MTLYVVIKLVVFGKLFYVTSTLFAALSVRPGQKLSTIEFLLLLFNVLGWGVVIDRKLKIDTKDQTGPKRWSEKLSLNKTCGLGVLNHKTYL